MTTTARLATLSLLCGTCVLLAPSGAEAQVTFYPSVVAQQSYVTNLNFVSDQGEDLSDWVTRASVALPVSREAPGNSWAFLYRPSIMRYKNNPILNHTAHLLQFDWNRTIGANLSSTVATFYTRGQASGDPYQLGLDINLSPRGNQEIASLAWALSKPISPRWAMNGALQGSISRTLPIEGVDNAVGLVTEDRNVYSAMVGAGKSISARSNIGFNYFYRNTEGDQTGGEDLHSVTFSGGYQLGRWSGLTYGAGTFSRGDRLDYSGSFGYNHNNLRTLRLGVLVERRAAAGGNLAGTSTNNRFSLFLGSTIETSFSWTISTRYELREGADENVFGNIRTWANFASCEWRPHRSVGIRLSYTHSTQSGSDLEGLNGNFTVAALGVVWYPRGYGQGQER